MKYDFAMETDESTSVGKIVAQIKENSNVLEFGPGNGRMTKYLIDEKQCQVSIVELDKVLYDHVRQFADDAFYGNIDEDGWVEYFAGQTFDYIVFADVLEHLMNPKEALKKVRPFLKEDGQILITFPNLAHNSVLIDLFNNKLTWRETGLLDATHKSFFLQEGFEHLFSQAELFIVKEDFTINQVGYNEIDSSYEDLPIEIRSAFQHRPFGEVYQYFYVLEKKPVSNPIRVIPENSSQQKRMHVLFDRGQKQEEFDILIQNVTGDNKTFTLDVPEDIQMVKLFPSLVGVVVSINIQVAETIIHPTATNALFTKGSTYYFSDAQVPVIEITDSKIKGQSVNVTVYYEFEGHFSKIEHDFIQQILAQNQNKGIFSKWVKRITHGKIGRLFHKDDRKI